MRAVIEVQRGREGRLVGSLDRLSARPKQFSGLMELIALIEDGLEADPTPPVISEGNKEAQ